MERDVDFDRWEDVPLEPIDLEPPELEPPEREPQPERPLGYDGDSSTGPWFGLSMGVFAAWTALTLLTLTAGREGGPVLAWTLIAGFTLLFVGFLATGAVWFGTFRGAGR